MTDLSELERLAREATEFRWNRDGEGWVQDCDQWEAQDYIAAASPAVILRLIEMARAAEKHPLATKYTIDGDPRRLGSDDIHIERAKQIEGPAKWAIRRMGACMNKTGEWEYEPMPSSRGDDFLSRCRFDSAEEAFAALREALEKAE